MDPFGCRKIGDVTGPDVTRGLGRAVDGNVIP